MSCGWWFRRRVSGLLKVGEQDAVVWVLRSDWESVTEREEFVGRLREASRLPQYLCRVGCKLKKKKSCRGGVPM